jgi:hypothetical protein
VKIAVIDGQINPDVPELQGTNLTVSPESACEAVSPIDTNPTDNAIHGTTITAMLIGNGSGASGIRGIVPDADVTFYSRGPIGSDCPLPPEAESAELSAMGWLIQQAIDGGADIITTSIGGGGLEPGDSAVIAEAIARKVPIVAAIPNDASEGGNLPWSFRGVIAANAVDAKQQLLLDNLGSPNSSLDVSIAAPGGGLATVGTRDGWDTTRTTSGASFAAPLVAGILAAAKQKYPDATNNQLIQSLAHNTGAEDHPLEYSADSGYGYGIASLGHVLRVDPTQYDDYNILVDKGGYDLPEDDEIAAAMENAGTTPSESATTTPAESPGPPASDASELSGILIVGGIVVAIVVVGAIILTIVLVRRSNSINRRGQS